MPAPDLAFAYEHCAALLREGDPDRHLATLFAPAPARPHLCALYAFSVEVARVREAVSSALPGEVRLQWWRDALDGEARGGVGANPVAAALDDTITRFCLPRQTLVDLVDARVLDLYDDPMPDVNALEGYCGETSSTLMRLAGIVLTGGEDPGGADAAGHAGVAVAVTGLLRAFPWHARRGQLYVPQDVLQRHGVTREDVVSGRGGPGLAAALGDMRRLARDHLDRARAVRGTLTRGTAPAYLPACVVPLYLAAMEGPGYDPYRSVVDASPWRKQLAYWRGAIMSPL